MSKNDEPRPDLSVALLAVAFASALEDLKVANQKFETNDNDNYDPCGYTAARCARELYVAGRALQASLQALLEAKCP